MFGSVFLYMFKNVTAIVIVIHQFKRHRDWAQSPGDKWFFKNNQCVYNVCAHVCLRMWLQTYMGSSEDNLGCQALPPFTLFESGSLCFSVATHSRSKITHLHWVSGFYVLSRDSNSGPDTCAASPFYPQSHLSRLGLSSKVRKWEQIGWEQEAG